jgi:hypothetical protein
MEVYTKLLNVILIILFYWYNLSMDLSIPLVGMLGVIGFNLNKPLNSREYTDKRVKIPASELANGKTIYEAKKFARSHQEERKRYEKIRKNNELVTLNSKSDIKEYSPVKKVRFSEKNINDYSVPVKMTKDSKVFNGPMFSNEKYFIPEESSKLFNSKETFDNISELTGQTSDFAHQNMVPFFGGKVKNGSSTSSLGLYTGTDNVMHKKEVEAIRNGPVDNVNGNVIFTDSIQQDRFIVSNKQTAMLPFEQARVKPIPAEYNRGQEKTIEELRTVNPKTTLEGRLTPGKTIARRGLQAELPETRIPTYYDATGRSFKTTGEEKGTYFQDTNHYRQTRKNITAESGLNQNGGVNYALGEIMRVTKQADGINTLSQPDKRGNFKGDWIRSRKSINRADSAPTKENISLRTQEREFGNREDIGNVSNKLAGIRHQVEHQLKTTNKELSLYTYKGGSSGNSIHKPENRDPYYYNQTKTRETRDYFSGGKKNNAPGVGVESVYFETKETVLPTRLQNSSVYVQPSTGLGTFGEVSKNKLEANEMDYGSRLKQNFQKQDYVRPYGSLPNNK